MLKSDIGVLKSEFEMLKREKQFDEILVVIQDFNDLFRLEKELPIPFRKPMKLLRQSRIENCHYVDVKEDDDVKIAKLIVTIKKLKGLSEDGYVKQELKKRFGVGLVEKILEELDHLLVINSAIADNVSEQDMIFAESWWRRN